MSREEEIRKASCACKGVRKCAVCSPDFVEKEKSSERSLIENLTKRIYLYCNKCNTATLIDESNRNFVENFLNLSITDLYCNCETVNNSPQTKLQVNGILVINDFINESEEKYLTEQMNKSKWVDSQSGRFKQDFGPKANFNRKKIKYSTFTGLPSYSKFLVERFRETGRDELKNFVPVELCNLRYESERGACIEPHYDDCWLWGERLITVNSLANTFLTLTSNEEENLNCEIFIPLKRRSLVVISDEARYKWLHAIKKSHIRSTRIATTWRELSDEFKDLSLQGRVGGEIERIALTYKGVSIGEVEEMALSETAKNDQADSNAEMNDFDRWNLQTLVSEKLMELTFETELNLVKNGLERLVYSFNIENVAFFLKMRKTNLDANYLYEIQTKIIKENFNLTNVKNFNRFFQLYDEFQEKNWNMCLQYKVEYEKLEERDTHFDNDELFKIGAQIAQWMIFSAKDLTFKSKSIATIYHFNDVLNQLSKNTKFEIGFVLNDFVPRKMFFTEKKNLGNQSDFQNVTYSYLLNDLAIAILSFLMAERREPQKQKDVIKTILSGFVSLKELNDAEFEFLYQLILLNLMLTIIKAVDSDYLDQLVALFNLFYIEDSF